MLRIHLTPADLARVRLASGPDRMWETLLAAHLVNRPAGEVVFGRWRSAAVAGLTPRSVAFLRLAAPRGYSPDFLTPGAGRDDFGDGVEAVLSTPRPRLRREMELVDPGRAGTRWVHELASGSVTALQGLGGALRDFHESAVRPFWGAVSRQVESERSDRMRSLLTGGTERLLSSLHPSVRWDGDVLSVDTAADRDVHLDGRGLTLVPSFFCWRAPITLLDPRLDPVLVYPIEHELGWAEPVPPTASSRALVALLGRTRAATLQALEVSAATGELARRLHVSPATASEHATVLREAGLVTTRREGSRVLHSLTPLGRRLLEGEGRVRRRSPA